MIKALIIEDEQLAVDYLNTTIKQVKPDIEIIGNIDSVESAVTWFNGNPQPDLLFLDIQLSDGLSFEIFNYVDVRCPIIFTTAYEEYAVKAFKLNSLDY
jgi:DNA-binding LytR/AlgR family response regulator